MLQGAPAEGGGGGPPGCISLIHFAIVQRHALRAWDEEQDFRELVSADREITGRVDLAAVFDQSAYTRHVDTVFERLRSLTRKEETVHA